MQIYFVFVADYVWIGRKDKGCADSIRAKQRRKGTADTKEMRGYNPRETTKRKC